MMISTTEIWFLPQPSGLYYGDVNLVLPDDRRSHVELDFI